MTALSATPPDVGDRFCGRRRQAFDRVVRLEGWSRRSRWGYDPVLEAYWVQLWRDDDHAAPAVTVGTCHLLTTVPGLARALGAAAGVGPVEAYVALTA